MIKPFYNLAMCSSSNELNNREILVNFSCLMQTEEIMLHKVVPRIRSLIADKILWSDRI